MRYGLSLLVMLAWGLWFGGLITLFLMVSHLFSADRATAVVAAPRMFLAFERYQLVIAAIALVATVAWRLIEPRAVLTTLFFMFAVASVGAIVNSAIITPRLEQLRRAGEASSHAFMQLHVRSMIVYMLEAAALLIAAGFILAGIFESAPRQTVPATAAASAPPAAPVDPPLSP